MFFGQSFHHALLQSLETLETKDCLKVACEASVPVQRAFLYFWPVLSSLLCLLLAPTPIKSREAGAPAHIQVLQTLSLRGWYSDEISNAGTLCFVSRR